MIYIEEDGTQHGFTRQVVLALGAASLPGLGPLTARQVGDPDNIDALLEADDIEMLISKLNSLGAKVTAAACGVSDLKGLYSRIIRHGNEIAEKLASIGAVCITPKSSLYPQSLKDLGERQPKWLFLRGNAKLLVAPSAAVVGTREPSHIGDFLTKYTVSACHSLGIVVVSGLARGIDSIAHEWALTTHTPTISVLGTGLFVSYPARNSGLANAIVDQGGLLVSEYIPTQGPTGEGFVWRNRLQAALSKCVIATEWNKSSGTAHTIRFANALGRPSVSMELDGVNSHPDAGRGSRHLIIPAENYELLELLNYYQFDLTNNSREDSIGLIDANNQQSLF